MSYNIFIESSVYNFGVKDFKILEEELNKVRNPKWIRNGDGIVIKEDFDMRHIKAIIKSKERIVNKNERHKILNNLK